MMMAKLQSDENQGSYGAGRTFVIKAVYPIDAGTFMITSQDEEVFWIFDLVCKEEADGFE